MQYIWRQLEEKRGTIESTLDATRVYLRAEGLESLQLAVDMKDGTCIEHFTQCIEVTHVLATASSAFFWKPSL